MGIIDNDPRNFRTQSSEAVIYKLSGPLLDTKKILVFIANQSPESVKSIKVQLASRGIYAVMISSLFLHPSRLPI